MLKSFSPIAMVVSIIQMVLACGLVTHAWAEEECKIFQDVGDKYSLGRIAIGTPQTDFMAMPAARACFSEASECIYVDEAGVTYTINLNESFDRNVVDRAEVTSAPPYHGRLLAGIELGDSIDTVRRKLKSLPKEFPEWHLDDRSEDPYYGKTFLQTGPCLRSTKGSIWRYLFVFDKAGILTDVDATEKHYEPAV